MLKKLCPFDSQKAQLKAVRRGLSSTLGNVVKKEGRWIWILSHWLTLDAQAGKEGWIALLAKTRRYPNASGIRCQTFRFFSSKKQLPVLLHSATVFIWRDLLRTDCLHFCSSRLSLSEYLWREQSENSCYSEHIVTISLILHPFVNRIVLRLNKMLQQQESRSSRRRPIRRTEPRERAERTYKVFAFLADILESFFIHLCMLCVPPLPALFPLTLHPQPKTAALWNWVSVPAPAYWAPHLVWVLLLCICSCKLFCYISWFCSLDLARTCWMASRCRGGLVILIGGRRRSAGGNTGRCRDIIVHWCWSTLLYFAFVPEELCMFLPPPRCLCFSSCLFLLAPLCKAHWIVHGAGWPRTWADTMQLTAQSTMTGWTETNCDGDRWTWNRTSLTYSHRICAIRCHSSSATDIECLSDEDPKESRIGKKIEMGRMERMERKGRGGKMKMKMKKEMMLWLSCPVQDQIELWKRQWEEAFDTDCLGECAWKMEEA